MKLAVVLIVCLMGISAAMRGKNKPDQPKTKLGDNMGESSMDGTGAESQLEKLTKKLGNPNSNRVQKLTKLKQKINGYRNQNKDEPEMGSGDVEVEMPHKVSKNTVVRTEEVKNFLSGMSAYVKDVNVPLEALKSELVDQVSRIKSGGELARFLQSVEERYDMPGERFQTLIKRIRFLISRLNEAGYENDPSCLNLQAKLKNMIPESGELPEDFHSRFLGAYLMSVSCLAMDNALFHNDLAELQELHEGSKRDQVLAALSKVMVGSIRLANKMSEQERAVKRVLRLLPEPTMDADDNVIYKRLFKLHE